jgi:cytochrome c551/c552
MTKLKAKSKKTMKRMLLAVAFLAVFNFSAQAEGPNAAEGKELFEQQGCPACHAIDRIVVGPALKDVSKRRSEEWLLKWIKNNVKLRQSGDADANQLYADWGGAAMNVYENLSDDQIKSILLYVEEASAPAPVKDGDVKTDGGESGDTEGSFYSKTTLYILISIALVLLILAYVLYRLKNSMQKLVKDTEGVSVDEKPNALRKKLSKINPTIATLGIISVIGLSLGAYGFYFGVTEVGVQRGYAPTQPIAFSHALHAGELNVDCRYCHSTVDHSKSASIPSLNTCMNCHAGVQAREKYNGEISPEIQKIYTALDYNPDEMPDKRYGPNPTNIKWVRIHNLPDLSYFNHAQHANVAGLECQQCHGPVQEMEVLQQHATLQMGWCIDCHRKTEVDVENNDYYEKLHSVAKKDIEKNGEKSKYLKDGKINITIANIGGLECSKCHY